MCAPSNSTSGGTVDVVQVPGMIVTPAHDLHERFEVSADSHGQSTAYMRTKLQDGTINYLSLPVIPTGLRVLRSYLPILPIRLSTLLHYLVQTLSELKHSTSGTPVVRILSHAPIDTVKHIGDASSAGFLASILFLDVSSETLICHRDSDFIDSQTVNLFHWTSLPTPPPPVTSPCVPDACVILVALRLCSVSGTSWPDLLKFLTQASPRSRAWRGVRWVSFASALDSPVISKMYGESQSSHGRWRMKMPEPKCGQHGGGVSPYDDVSIP
jgi:hypothetical protein